jgi:hypothetical protein
MYSKFSNIVNISKSILLILFPQIPQTIIKIC